MTPGIDNDRTNDESANAQLQAAIQVGIESGDYQSSDQVFAELRTYAESLEARSA